MKLNYNFENKAWFGNFNMNLNSQISVFDHLYISRHSFSPSPPKKRIQFADHILPNPPKFQYHHLAAKQWQSRPFSRQYIPMIHTRQWRRQGGAQRANGELYEQLWRRYNVTESISWLENATLSKKQKGVSRVCMCVCVCVFGIDRDVRRCNIAVLIKSYTYRWELGPPWSRLRGLGAP